jgi:hypothetical protein
MTHKACAVAPLLRESGFKAALFSGGTIDVLASVHLANFPAQPGTTPA